MPDIDDAQPYPQGRSAYPSPFGRGWIPEGRDIGLPGETGREAGAGGACAPSPSGEGVGGGVSPRALHPDERPHPNPSPEGEGLVAPPPLFRADQFTPARQVRFLDALSALGSVRAACARVGVSAECVYRLRRRDAVFARGWAAALVLAAEAAGEELATRALHGIEEPVFLRGEQVGSRRRFDARLLLAHVARLDRLADDHAARGDAARFDELLAIVHGTMPDGRLYIPGFLENEEDGGEETVLPCTRDDYAEVRVYRRNYEAAASDDGDAPPRVSRREARAQAEDEWDAWYQGACATVDRVVAGADGAAADAGEPPYEVKSMDGPAILPVAAHREPVEGGEGDRDAQRRGGGGGRPDAAPVSSQRPSPGLRQPEGPRRQPPRACRLPVDGEDRAGLRTVSTVSTCVSPHALSATVTPFQKAMRSRMGSAFSLGSG